MRGNSEGLFLLPQTMPKYYPQLDRWPVAPGIRLEGNVLHHDPIPLEAKKWRLVDRPTSGLLSGFVDLTDAPAQQIEAYAKKWGCLGLCRHGRPGAAVLDYHSDHNPLQPWHCLPVGREPLSYWRGYAGMFRDALEQSGRAHTNRFLDYQEAIAQVLVRVNFLAVGFGHLRPVVERTNAGDVALRLAGMYLDAGLAAALSFQLMVAVTSGKSWLICAECGQWFESNARRSSDRNAFCPKCGRAAAMRAASRRYYDDHKKKRGKEKDDGTQTKRG